MCTEGGDDTVRRQMQKRICARDTGLLCETTKCTVEVRLNNSVINCYYILLCIMYVARIMIIVINIIVIYCLSLMYLLT